MLSNEMPMNLQYFAEEGSQSQPGAQGGDGGESGNPTGQGNGTQNNGKTGDQSNSQNFMEGIIKKALAGASSNQQQTQTQKNGKTGDQSKDNNESSSESSNNNLPKTQAELDALITKRISREYQKGLDDGKKSGMTEAQRLASMTDDQRAQEERNKVLQENNKLKAQIARQDMLTEVERQLSDSGYSLKPDEISLLIGDTAEQTNANVSLFNSMMERNITKAKQDLYKGNAPKSNGGTTQKTNIGEEIAKKFSNNDDRFKGLFFDKKNN